MRPDSSYYTVTVVFPSCYVTLTSGGRTTAHCFTGQDRRCNTSVAFTRNFVVLRLVDPLNGVDRIVCRERRARGAGDLSESCNQQSFREPP